MRSLLKAAFSIAVLAVPVAAHAQGSGHGEFIADVTCAGIRLTIKELAFPRHDKDPGRCRIVLRRISDSTEILSSERSGLWCLLGTRLVDSTFVLGGLFEVGAWLPVRTVAFLRARDGNEYHSRFGTDGWYAMASQTDSAGRWLAFVGARADEGSDRIGICVLDLERDTIVRLGRPPAPRPLEDYERDMFPDAAKDFGWGSPPRDGYHFEDMFGFRARDVLWVSYGDDTALKRAARRKERKWRMGKLFAH